MPDTMVLPLLAPSTTSPLPSVVYAPQTLPTKAQWAALRDEIERLYVHRRWKLRDVMHYMERLYGFKAS